MKEIGSLPDKPICVCGSIDFDVVDNVIRCRHCERIPSGELLTQIIQDRGVKL